MSPFLYIKNVALGSSASRSNPEGTFKIAKRDRFGNFPKRVDLKSCETTEENTIVTWLGVLDLSASSGISATPQLRNCSNFAENSFSICGGLRMLKLIPD